MENLFEVSMHAGVAVVDDENRWRAVLARDRRCNGQFVMGVMSTGIYCRPSCPARRPAREHVRFFGDGACARAAGLRPCRRCMPDDISREERGVSLALAAMALADVRGEKTPPLEVLAMQAGYSRTYFQRLFVRATGLSPAGLARASRIERARNILSEMVHAGGRVTDAVYDSGFSTTSRFYEGTRQRLGMAPSVWAHGGRGVSIRWAIVATTLAPMLVAASDKGLCRLAFNESAADLAKRFPHAELLEGGEDFVDLVSAVVSLVETPGDSSHIPLDVRGTAFQEAVWRELTRIAPGETRSYAQLAAAAGYEGAARAAGNANSANPVAVLIPCHRVIRGNGSLGGYAYGAAIKSELLRREGVR